MALTYDWQQLLAVCKVSLQSLLTLLGYVAPKIQDGDSFKAKLEAWKILHKQWPHPLFHILSVDTNSILWMLMLA